MIKWFARTHPIFWKGDPLFLSLCVCLSFAHLLNSLTRKKGFLLSPNFWLWIKETIVIKEVLESHYLIIYMNMLKISAYILQIYEPATSTETGGQGTWSLTCYITHNWGYLNCVFLKNQLFGYTQNLEYQNSEHWTLLITHAETSAWSFELIALFCYICVKKSYKYRIRYHRIR